MKAKILTLVGACSAVACSSEQGKKQTAEGPMNVLLIIADDMGYADLGSYGNPYIKTPNLDRLASEGVRFTQGYSGSAVSSPSRCALITGFHTGHTRIRNNFVDAEGIEGTKGRSIIRRQHITPQDTTIATVLKQAGYATGLVNKWHMDGFNPDAGPLDNGFDEFKGWLVSTGHSNDPYYYPYNRFNGRELVNIPENADGKKVRHNNDISTEEAIDYIDRHQNEPFFLYLAYDSPHEPYIINDTMMYNKFDWNSETKQYAALVTSMDRNIGRVLDRLDELNLTDNTLIIFVSDNGGATMAPHKELRTNGVLRGNKGNFYEGGIRVPIIVKAPFAQPGLVTDEPVFFPDIMPTIAEATGARAPQGIDGQSWIPLLKGEPVNFHDRTMFWEFPGHSYAVRQGAWKAVHRKNQPTELYNIEQDISETTNLADQYPDLVKRFETIAEAESVPSPNFPNAWPLQ